MLDVGQVSPPLAFLAFPETRACTDIDTQFEMTISLANAVIKISEQSFLHSCALSLSKLHDATP